MSEMSTMTHADIADNSWTSGEPFTATEQHCKLRWNCRKPGEMFRCFRCGHKFVPGDTVRWVFTNDVPGAGGNPFVCGPCDGPKEELVAEILLRRSDERMWWFR
jgi:hypothetical protein